MKIGDEIVLFDELKSSLFYRKNDFITGSWKHLVLIFLHPKCRFCNSILNELTHIQARFMEHVELIGLKVPPNTIKNYSIDSNNQVNYEKVNFKILDTISIDILKKYEVLCIPQAFVFKNKKLVYKGAINDNPIDPRRVKHHYLTDVLEKIMRNLKIISNYPPVGTELEIT